MTVDSTSKLNADLEQQLESVIADYIRGCEAGAPSDRRKILERHPEFAEDLRQFFAQRDRMNELAEPIRGFCDDLLKTVGPGRQISYVGNYELLEEIARGGMGIVYRARQQTLGRIVAVKMMLTGCLANEEHIKRFQIEAQAAASLQHPNIVPIHEVGQHEGLHYFSMDFVEGRSLSAILRENLLSPKQAAIYVRQMAEAIHYAHQQGTLHRDLKPSNVLIDNRDQVRITDFGLASRVEEDSDLTRTGQPVGTPSYMPPEQAIGKRNLIGPGSDVYSLGAILYECLTGRAPFRAESVMKTIEQVIHVEAASPRLLNPSLPRDLETICLKCLEKEPGRRYATAQLLADELGRYVSGEPILARPISRSARLWRWCRKKPLVASLSTATLLLLVGIATISTMGYMREADLRQSAETLKNRAETGERAARETATDLREALTRLKEKHIELVAEQTLTRQQVSTITGLKQKREQLEEAVDEIEHHLNDNLLRLARSEWQNGNVVLADQHLEKCPKHLQGTEWHRLKRLWLPNVRRYEGHTQVAFSADGTRLAMPGNSNCVEVRETATQKVIYSLTGHKDRVLAVSISGDGTLLATGGRDRTIQIWSLSDGTLLRTLESHSRPVTDLEFSGDGKRLASASFESTEGKRSGEVIVWNRETFQEERRLPGYGRVAFGMDGRSIASQVAATDDKVSALKQMVQVWNLGSPSDPTIEPFLTIPVVQTELTPMVFSPDGQAIAVIGAAHSSQNAASLEIWNLSRKELQQRLPLDFQVHSLAFSPDAKRLACGGRDGFSEAVSTTFKVVTFKLITGECDRMFPWYQRTVTDLAYDRGGRQLATATSDEVRVWDVTSPSDPTQAILDSIAEHNVAPGDWPQWGGSTSKINTPAGRNIPIDWDTGFSNRDPGPSEDRLPYVPKPASRFGEVPEGSRNIKWAARLGSQTYGNPVVANGRVFVGTNNAAGYLKRYSSKIDLGVLLCFEEATGNFLWQHSNTKLPTGRVHDWPLQGICSTPVIDGNRLWYVTNRGEIVCLDTEGFYDGEDDGPEKMEWSCVLRVGALLHGQIDWRVPGPLLESFANAGFKLSKPVYVEKDVGGVSWIIREQQTDSAGRTIRGTPLYRVKLVDDKLSVSVASTGEQAEEPNELFSINNHLLPQLGTPQVIFAMKGKLAELGITLSRGTEPTTDEPGRVWSFVGIRNGTEAKFQVRTEGFFLGIYQQVAPEADEADVVWKFDMIRQLGVSPHNMSNCSILTVDGVLFVCTSNGVDEGHINIPAPNAPSFIAMDRVTGRILWTDNSPGKNILHAQWASPSYGVFEGQPQVIFPGGDGWVYSFDPKGDGNGGSRLLWKFDANPKESIYSLGGRATRNSIISFPAIYDGLVYIVVGEDPEHGEGIGHLWCIDPVKRINGADVSAELAVDSDGNIIPHRRLQAVDLKKGERAVPNPNSAVRWHYASQDRNGNGKIEFEETFHRSISIPVIKDDILYIADFAGLFHCLNAKSGKCYWTYDMFAACWGSALLVDGHVYICDEDGDVNVFRHSADPDIAMDTIRSKEGRVISREPINAHWNHPAEHLQSWQDYTNMGDSIYMTPIVANNVLYIATKNMLYAIQEQPDSQTLNCPDATVPANREVLDAQEVQSRLEFAHRLAAHRRWQHAIAQYEIIVDQPPRKIEFWCEYATVLLLQGNDDSYDQVCQSVVERFGSSALPLEQYLLARILALSPKKVNDPDLAVKLAELGVAGYPSNYVWCRHTLAVALYRSGRFETALEECEQAIKIEPAWTGNVVNWLLLAMIHEKLGHTKEAREWMDKSVHWIDKAARASASGDVDLPLPSWLDRLELQLLYREAKAMASHLPLNEKTDE